MTVAETLAELVSIDSVSARANTEIISYLAASCQAAGLAVKRFPHIDDAGTEKTNLVALAGAGFSDKLAIELALIGHTDTVPYDPTWTEALQLTAKDGKLFGRGACDTKAFIAATLTAIEGIDISQLKKPLALIFTADEEDMPIGVVGLSNVNSHFKNATLWTVLGDKSYGGRGYATRAVSGMLTLGFEELGLHTINTWIVEHNPSVRVAERVKFRPFGRQRQCHYIDGRPYDRLWFDLVASEHAANGNV